MSELKCPFCGEPRLRFSCGVNRFACGTVGPYLNDGEGEYETGHTCDIHTYSRLFKDMEQRLASAEARSYERIAEIDEIREQLANAREGDNWVLMARESIANGNCPWCFCMDEGPHQPGCYVNEIEAENSRLHRELCEMSEPRLKLHATIQQLAERLASAEAFVAKHKCQTCGGVRVREAELCCCDEAAKGGRDE